MKFEVNQEVWVRNENVIKTIVDKETIDNIEIYYMSDKTSYASFNLVLVNNTYHNVVNEVNENPKKLIKLLNFNRHSEKWANALRNYDVK